MTRFVLMKINGEIARFRLDLVSAENLMNLQIYYGAYVIGYETK